MRRVEEKPAKPDGVSAAVDPATGRARVSHPARVGPEELVAAAEKADCCSLPCRRCRCSCCRWRLPGGPATGSCCASCVLAARATELGEPLDDDAVRAAITEAGYEVSEAMRGAVA
ncbi:hypothetical protein SHIRM173S_04172 [Streptomyces hirsutus]